MLRGVKKAVFRVLCLGALCLGELMAEQDSKELIFSGITIYTDKDFTRAKEYFEKACELNEALTCTLVGEFYRDGEGVAKDLKKAFEYSAKACELNDAKGCYALAAFYNEGKGVAKDEKQTTENLEKSCKLGLKEACDILKEQKQ
ncbi:hypothetical protein APV63_07450 [Helicobacter pylori]|uniref:tetratricopeptide repeat protein n=1 Tax=Helicobacter pylori TaxID=210 RepID=UPI00071F7317|nr:tetratricopeptide repeat protein [Helicobacter pylori]ALM81436.1 hypothetical protein APV63_07450 [Helicobacter pylori]